MLLKIKAFMLRKSPITVSSLLLAVFFLLTGCSTDDRQTGNADGIDGKKPGNSEKINGAGLNIELRQPQFDQKLAMPEPDTRPEPASPLDF